MGCDIHMFIEHRRDADSPWMAFGEWGASPCLDDEIESFEWFQQNRGWWIAWHAEGLCPHPDVVEAAKSPDAPRFVKSPVAYKGRSYTLFAALAGVRNQEMQIVPIVAPRGVPDDVTNLVRDEWARWGPDAHTASHATLTELTLCEGWEQTFTYECWVCEGGHPNRARLSDERFARLESYCNEYGEFPSLSPDAWNLSTCGWSSDPEPWRTLRYRARLDLNVGQDWWLFMAGLHRVGLQSGADNVRIVYWFDN